MAVPTDRRMVRDIDGGVIEETAVGKFRASLRGRLLRPGDDGYEASRRVYNASIDKYPALIAKCAGVADVINSVNFARDNRLLLAVKGGGHSVAGKSVCDGGLMMDLSGLKGIRVDPAKRTARTEGGVTWGEFDHETGFHGLATTGGMITSTGIAGLTLGGGIGWLMGRYGLTCDNLLSADVVTADGRSLVASPEENQSLFWGLRGGGGNFGVVTSFKYRLHPLSQVLAGTLAWPYAKAEEVLRRFRDIRSNIPDELGIIVALSRNGEPTVSAILCYAGPVQEGEKVIEPLRRLGPPAIDEVKSLPYVRAQRMLDEMAPAGLYNYWRSGFMDDLPDDAIQVILEHGKTVPTDMSTVQVWSQHGAVSRAGSDAAAFCHRSSRYILEVLSIWRDPMEAERSLAWNRSLWDALQPFMADRVYVNFLGAGEEERVRAAYGENYERLVALKDRYDPTNLFRLNPNIEPTSSST